MNELHTGSLPVSAVCSYAITYQHKWTLACFHTVPPFLEFMDISELLILARAGHKLGERSSIASEVVLIHAIKAYGCGGTDPLIHKFRTMWQYEASLTSESLHPREKFLVPIEYEEAGWAPKPVWIFRRKEFLTRSENWTRMSLTSSPMPSHYID
jgi:hypothetical protein